MVDFIPSNLIDVTRNAPRKTERKRPQTASEKAGKARFSAPGRADLNEIPSPDLLRTMVENAREALKNGVYWDRGSIVNLLM